MFLLPPCDGPCGFLFQTSESVGEGLRGRSMALDLEGGVDAAGFVTRNMVAFDFIVAGADVFCREAYVVFGDSRLVSRAHDLAGCSDLIVRLT